MVFFASASRPWRNTYLGLSRNRRIPNPRIIAHRNIIPKGIRHDAVLGIFSVPKLMRFAMRIPIAMNN